MFAKFPLVSLLRQLCFLLAVFSSAVAFAQETDPVDVDQAQIRRGSMARLYWARVVMEDYERWHEASELVRFVVMNDSKLPNPVLRKLRQVHFTLRRYPAEEFARQTFDMRHLTRAFLKTQYLLNEAIMDLRININESNDVELVLARELIQSYFFPGAEDYGEVLYPADASYNFDLYALTKVNIAAAAQAPANRPEESQKGRPNIASPPVADGDSKKPGIGAGGIVLPSIPPGAGGSILPQGVVNQSALDRLSLLNRQAVTIEDDATIQPASDFVPGMPTKGFLEDLIELGDAADKFLEWANDVWKEVRPADRVPNRYLPESLMLQALSDPGSAILDPQIQDFLRGTRLKLKVADLTEFEKNDVIETFAQVGGKQLQSVKSKEGAKVWGINLSELIQEQEQSSGAPQLDLIVEHNQDDARKWTLYAVSAAGGADLMVMRTLAALLKVGKEWSTVKKVLFPDWVFKNGRFAEYVAKIPAKLADISDKKMAYKGTSWWHAMGWFRLSGLQAWYGSISLGHKAKVTLSPKMAEFVARLEKSKLYRGTKKGVRSGFLLYFVTVAAAATEVSTGILDLQVAQSEAEAIEIGVTSMAKAGSYVTYVLPYVGWPALGLDVVNRIGWTEYETADLYRRGQYFLMELFTGRDLTKTFMEGFEAQYNLPESQFNFDLLRKRMENPNEDPELLKLEITTSIQDLSHRYLNVFYQGHKEVLRFGKYDFALKVEEYLEDFHQARAEYQEILNEVKRKMDNGFYGFKPVLPEEPPEDNEGPIVR